MADRLHYDPRIGRFVAVDPHKGLVRQPITFNKYLYANSDAVNRKDPSGRMSLGEVGSALSIAARLVNVAVGSFLGTDFVLGARRHNYNYQNAVCKNGEPKCNAKDVFFALRHFPAPVQQAALGLGRPVENGEELLLMVWSPVWTTHNGIDMIRNETRESHIYFNGVVERTVVPMGGGLGIRSSGWGVGNIAATNVLLAGAVWYAMDKGIAYFLSGDQ